ncbi:hypothetical protein AXG93_857s1390 [Marchantia polymorpha subsp. ruderalis]|uniref:Uncharacterized protein n=1 Tax=Marchantia polymorpha subsp. ruderalis TaxID=1480154 RepID=A0A176WFC5_MARPO|nr:hypothetical protein AXG93_857s1390 [Marchantia polymorpha subsp. ruderalis]
MRGINPSRTNLELAVWPHAELLRFVELKNQGKFYVSQLGSWLCCLVIAYNGRSEQAVVELAARDRACNHVSGCSWSSTVLNLRLKYKMCDAKAGLFNAPPVAGSEL